MLVLAVVLHNIPEGMAVGVVFAGVMSQNSLITLSGALALPPINQIYYPKATSKIIIITKPAANPIVPILECSPADDSGINSSTTT